MRLVIIDSSSESMLDIDYFAAKASGVDGVILRAGYGSDVSQIEPGFKEAYNRAIEAGMLVGAYWMNYFRSVEDAVAEAEVFHSAIEGCDLQLGNYADYEEDTIDYMDRCGGSKEDFTSRIIAFMNRMIELGHHKSRFYSNTNCFNGAHGAGALDAERLEAYGFWHAHYNGDENTTEKEFNGLVVVGHQFADNNMKPSWIQGCPNIDVSIFYLDDVRVNQTIDENTDTIEETQAEQINEPTQAPQTSTDAYIVQSGDTLSGIASSYGIGYQELADFNRIADPNLIYPGQAINFPGIAEVQTEQPSYRTYTVQPKDSLWGIAATELGSGLRYHEIKDLNGLTSDVIYPGNILKLPQ